MNETVEVQFKLSFIQLINVVSIYPFFDLQIRAYHMNQFIYYLAYFTFLSSYAKKFDHFSCNEASY